MSLSYRYGLARVCVWLSYIGLIYIVGFLGFAVLTPPAVPTGRNVFSVEALPYLAPFLGLIILLALVIGIGSFYVLPPLRRQMRLHMVDLRSR